MENLGKADRTPLLAEAPSTYPRVHQQDTAGILYYVFSVLPVLILHVHQTLHKVYYNGGEQANAYKI